MLIIKRLNTFKFHVKHVNFNTNWGKVASFAKQTSYVQKKNRDDDTCVPIININRIAQNKNLTYFAIGFSVISLTISKPMLEIRLESMQQTELRLKYLIIIGRSKVSPHRRLSHLKKQLRSCHATSGNSILHSPSWT